jgi:hypothetical protein
MIGDLDKYRCDNLVLLVGTNPLPNLVAAEMLAKEGCKIILLHSPGSRGTGPVAERLEQVLVQSKGDKIKTTKIEVDESNGWWLAQKLKHEVLPKLQGSIGLNYTGGTKSMAVHSYKTVAEECPEATFSYLDARTLSLMVQPRSDEPFQMIRDIWRFVKVPVTQLLSLHGHQIQSPSSDPVLPDRAGQLASLFPGLNKKSVINFHESIRKPNGKLKSNTELSKVRLPDFAAAVFKDFGDICDIGDLGQAVELNPEKLVRWLDGCWLEHQVMSCLADLRGDLALSDLAMNIETTSRDNPGQTKFEFDVAAMRGYQLFAISCTISGDKDICKDKLFEAWIRARQMGGDESHTALVCCYGKDPGTLQQKLNEQWFSEGHIRVFGERDIGNLKASLRDWILSANN